jgi:recombination DNA repair RAD52 pathway protein
VKQDGKGFDHLEAHDVRSHLTRVFGFGMWDLQEKTELVFEQPTTIVKKGQDKPLPNRWDVCYTGWARILVTGEDGQCLYEGSATGSALNQDRWDAHDNALKSAASGALKRAAVNLGDQFGLSLYAGSNAPIVRGVIGWDPPKEKPEGDGKVIAFPKADGPA